MSLRLRNPSMLLLIAALVLLAGIYPGPDAEAHHRRQKPQPCGSAGDVGNPKDCDNTDGGGTDGGGTDGGGTDGGGTDGGPRACVVASTTADDDDADAGFSFDAGGDMNCG